MAFYRLTEEASMLEVSEEYMRAYTGTLKYDVVWYLRLVMDLLSPLKVTVAGETRTGGFMRSLLMDTNTDYYPYHTPIIPFLVITAAVQLRGIGVLKHDGIVPSISDRIESLSCSIVSFNPSFRGTRITIPLDSWKKHMPRYGDGWFEPFITSFKIEGDIGRLRIIEKILKTVKAGEKPFQPNIRIKIKIAEDLREYDANLLEEELEKKKRETKTIGYVLVHKGFSMLDDAIFYKGDIEVLNRAYDILCSIYPRDPIYIMTAPLDYRIVRKTYMYAKRTSYDALIVETEITKPIELYTI